MSGSSSIPPAQQTLRADASLTLWKSPRNQSSPGPQNSLQHFSKPLRPLPSPLASSAGASGWLASWLSPPAPPVPGPPGARCPGLSGRFPAWAPLSPSAGEGPRSGWSGARRGYANRILRPVVSKRPVVRHVVQRSGPSVRPCLYCVTQSLSHKGYALMLHCVSDGIRLRQGEHPRTVPRPADR